MNPITYFGKYKTDNETYLIVQTAPLVFSMRLDHRVMMIASYIAQTIIESRDELEAPAIGADEQTGFFVANVSGESIGIGLYDTQPAVGTTKFDTFPMYYDTHDAH